ncbi:OmpH family outer membrane protein [Phenylobacterium immobile]|uniref:OmpH family outer membrane protein n=1 Tax=Phenylobacterium immobile TaxID=21 RepID=UPI000AAC3618|nr:OmpH family outer membrane protein [Phenylobacterium immobile]
MSVKQISAAMVALAALVAGQAQAQTAAPAAAPAVRHGAPIAGLCTLSPEAVAGTSTVGKYVSTRLQQIAAQVNAELAGEKTAIDNEAKALQAAPQGGDQAALQSRLTALQTRAEAFNRKAGQREQEIQATEQKALARISTEMNPLVRQAYEAKGCAILLQREAVLMANPASDITPAVVTALNAKITQFTFDRERLDGAAAAPK